MRPAQYSRIGWTTRQLASTADLLFTVPQVLAFLPPDASLIGTKQGPEGGHSEDVWSPGGATLALRSGEGALWALRAMPGGGRLTVQTKRTPTGAALLRQIASQFGPMPQMRIEKTGYGSGTRDYAGRPNVLRAIMGEAAAQPQHAETIAVLEANVDDMNPELMPALVASALEKGARFAIREGGRTVGAGTVTDIIE